MKILTLLGSPRKKGNTATVLGWFEELAAPYADVEHIQLPAIRIHGCQGCNTCQTILDEPGCMQRDDLKVIIQRLMEADVIVYASPVYGWGFSAQMKALLDRQYCLTKWDANGTVHSLLAGKRAALLVTCGGGVESDADLILATFDRVMAIGGLEVIAKTVVPGCFPGLLPDAASIAVVEMFHQIVSGRQSVRLEQPGSF